MNLWERLHGGRKMSASHCQLAARLDALERELAALRQAAPQARDPKSEAQIVIEYLNIEQITVDRVDYENNFGALGIRELQGQLNIGANYRMGMPKRQPEGGQDAKSGGPPKTGDSPKPPGQEGPRVNMKARGGTGPSGTAGGP